MKNILIFLLLPFLSNAQVDTVYARSLFLWGEDGTQCEFKFNETEVGRPMFNPYGFYDVYHQYENGSHSIYMNMGKTLKTPDTLVVDGTLWVRVDAVDLKSFKTHKDRGGRVTIITTEADIPHIACGCYKKINRA